MRPDLEEISRENTILEERPAISVALMDSGAEG